MRSLAFMDAIKVTHDGVEIIYDENENRWRFELRGRQRSSESLAKAKEAIDKPVDEKVEKTFKRTKVFYSRYGQSYLMGEATSVAESRGYSETDYVWVVSGKERNKIAARDVFPQTENNIALVAQIAELEKQMKGLRDKITETAEKLIPISV